MKILVTGSNGQLGCEISGLAKSYPAYNFLFTDLGELDITDGTQVNAFFELHNPEVVINCAAYTAVDKAEDEREKAFLVNAQAVANLARASQTYGALIIHISTDYVFDGKGQRPYLEEDQTNPQSVYGESKLAGEKAIYEFAVKGVILRTSWLYSAFGHNFVKTMMRLGHERETLNVVNDQYGTPTYALDLATTILDLIPKFIQLPQIELFHYSNEGVTNWCDFAQTIFGYAQITCTARPILSKDYPTAAARPAYSVLSKTKIVQFSGIPIPSWEARVKACIDRIGLGQ